ncbi:MAG: DUF1489 domain-containing protein [Caulobacteraceae bacterium]|nr:DUF1489 domain-containing protein [Caulobacteraceae bacterium]
MATLHLVKLCVGCDTVDELLAWRRTRDPPGEPWRLHTRQTPRRGDELVAGGSLFRVFRGFILSRQRILKVETIGAGPAARCHIHLDERVVLTAPTPRRPFQGWRYLRPEDAPPDLAMGLEEAMPPPLARRLRELGAW